MKNIFKWFLALIIILVMVSGLEIVKLTLLGPDPMDFDHGAGGPPWHGGPPPEAFHPDRPDMAGHPDFGPPPAPSAEMKLKFALADATNILIYVVLFVPLLYGAFQLGKRAFNLPRFNTVTRSSAYSDDASKHRSDERSNQQEMDVVLSASDEYSLLDNHLLDQLL